jgi:hypothetical protein
MTAEEFWQIWYEQISHSLARHTLGRSIGTDEMLCIRFAEAYASHVTAAQQQTNWRDEAHRLIKERNEIMNALHISRFGHAGHPYEVPAEPGPRTFATLPEAVAFAVNDCEKAESLVASLTKQRPKLYDWKEKPESCPECDSKCFISAGGGANMKLVCYHCDLIAEISSLTKERDKLKNVNALYIDRKNDLLRELADRDYWKDRAEQAEELMATTESRVESLEKQLNEVFLKAQFGSREGIEEGEKHWEIALFEIMEIARKALQNE